MNFWYSLFLLAQKSLKIFSTSKTYAPANKNILLQKQKYLVAIMLFFCSSMICVETQDNMKQKISTVTDLNWVLDNYSILNLQIECTIK